MKSDLNKYELVKDTLVLILAGGRGSRLHELTDKRAKPALYFGGNRRIIDFALSNCINSGLNRIGVVTQYAAHSLLRHLQTGWSFLPQERGEFVDMLPARQQIDDSTWYRGTADAVYQNMAIIRNHYRPKYILILAGDHIYKQDYSVMLMDHVRSGAKCTVGCIEVPRSEASEFGVMAVNENLKVKAFVEKPKDPPAMVGKPDTSLASMGIYVFDAEYLYKMLDPLLRMFIERENIPVQEEDKQFIIDFYKYGFVGMVLEWIRRDMKTEPAIMAERLNTMMHGDLERALLRFSTDGRASKTDD